MTNARESKSARNASPETAETVVTARSDAFGTATIPDATPTKPSRKKAKPADRVIEILPVPSDPTPPKPAGRKRKVEPTVATKPAVPDWAKRAAAHDTPAEMAAVPEAAPEAPAAKKGRTPKPGKPKAAPAKPATPKAAAGSIRAIGTAWIDSIRAAGHTPSTVSSYGADLEAVFEFFGEATPAADLTEKQIAKFNVCDLVMKKRSGKAKAQPTI